MKNLIKILKIPVKKVAIELNQEIIDKKKLNKINLNKKRTRWAQPLIAP